MIRLDRIEEQRNKKGWSQRELERRCGLGVGGISKWSRHTPSADKIKVVADALGVSVAYLTGESDFQSEQDAVIDRWVKEQNPGLKDEVRRIEAGMRIPVLGEVPCGIPIEAIELIDADDWEEIPERLSRIGEFFGLYAKGDSMSPRIEAGDVLIVKLQPTADTGDIVIVKIDDDACCKKYIHDKNHIILQSYNPDYPPKVFTGAEMSKVSIVGVVVENRQKFKKY